MAEHAHVSEKLLESLDEHPKDLIADMARTFANSKNPGSREYMRELFRQVLAIAHHGRAVVMGRGAQLMVAHDAAFRVRVVAPLEFRIAQVMIEKAINKSAAKAEIARIDAEYAGFIRENWSTDIDSLSLYDLILNTKDLGVEGAATTIISAYRERFAQVMEA
jgi:cytidylate kinase